MTPFLTIALLVVQSVFSSASGDGNTGSWIGKDTGQTVSITPVPLPVVGALPDLLGALPDLREALPDLGGALPDTIKAGQTLIKNLPDSLHGQVVLRYRGVRLPAFSWLYERSFFWRTAETDIGEHELWFRAFLDGELSDSISVSVTVE